MSLEMTPVTRAFGAVVSGVDLSKDLAESVVARLSELLVERKVLFFRNQPITPQAQRDFAARFGTLHVHPIYPVLPELPEILLIDNDIIGAAQRTIKGIEVSEERLSFEIIRDVCLNGPGHYLGSAQTLQLMHTEYLYPEVGDRKSPNEWAEQGALAIQQRAALRVREILASHYPSHVSAAIDAEIRARFPIRLPRSAMEPAVSADTISAIQRVAG